jgi:hypothetical protein
MREFMCARPRRASLMVVKITRPIASDCVHCAGANSPQKGIAIDHRQGGTRSFQHNLATSRGEGRWLAIPTNMRNTMTRCGTFAGPPCGKTRATPATRAVRRASAFMERDGGEGSWICRRRSAGTHLLDCLDETSEFGRRIVSRDAPGAVSEQVLPVLEAHPGGA